MFIILFSLFFYMFETLQNKNFLRKGNKGLRIVEDSELLKSL